ncbi:MAG: SRPBCC domain-containing protein [Chloroflexi bacterium]|nr:SRPBCC domain-containing protein [Chloroflexota bacterium]
MNVLRIETRLPASRHAVYTCWTFANMLSHWLCERATVDLRPGGVLSLSWYRGHWAAGIYSAVEPEQRLAFSWLEHNAPGATQIEVTFADAGSDTSITLTQSGFGSGDAWEAYRSAQESEWAQRLADLHVLLETANDARYLRRPVLGVSIEPLSQSRAAALGLREGHGVQLTAAPEDGPAGQAGLQPGDAIASIGGVPMHGFSDISVITSRFAAGDVVEVAYARAGRMHTTVMTLGKREPAHYPHDRESLYTLVRERIEQVETDLTALFDGVAEEHLQARPAEGEWSANDVLAHLIWTERWTQQALWLMHTAGVEMRWGENNPFEIDGIREQYPTSAELLPLLRRTLREELRMIASIDDRTASIKPLFALMSGWLTFIDAHLREHFEQISAAIAAARQRQPA